ncbi:ankyrin repeat-containing domain protein [Aspergillus alliaceus]|uniref:Ankyrin repeat-containing domain protein n=1 Tax=Petromyces alliaceus TaxID=209559 RepID=A0A5N7C5J0_PETAA|nr:ankyrin repeat-containing domain protein [Aspergillus alliaceus]
MVEGDDSDDLIPVPAATHWPPPETGELSGLVMNIVLPSAPGSRKFPIMVYIHGGSLLYGGANLPIFDGVNLVTQSIETGMPIKTCSEMAIKAAGTSGSAVGVGRERSTSLHHAVQRDCLLIARLLVANDQLDPSITDHLLRTPLHWAAGNGNLRMVNLLLSRQDVLLNAEDIDGSTPLMLAVIRDHTDVAKRLARASRRNRQSEWS